MLCNINSYSQAIEFKKVTNKGNYITLDYYLENNDIKYDIEVLCSNNDGDKVYMKLISGDFGNNISGGTKSITCEVNDISDVLKFKIKAKAKWEEESNCRNCKDGYISKTKDCNYCSGEGTKRVRVTCHCDYGYIECSKCNGDGMISKRCSYCSGEGFFKYKCEACRGKGVLICAPCGGTGRYWNGRYYNECSGCRGKGLLMCSSCKGSGIYADDCYACDDGEVKDDCNKCSGDGERLHSKCSGKGYYYKTSNCDDCNGTGKKKYSEPCSKCNASGELIENKTKIIYDVKIFIPTTNQKIVIRNFNNDETTQSEYAITFKFFPTETNPNILKNIVVHLNDSEINNSKLSIVSDDDDSGWNILKVDLKEGKNTIQLKCHDQNIQSKKFTVTYNTKEQKIYILSIGISRYRDGQNLNYADNDAEDFSRLLKNLKNIASSFTLTNEEATNNSIIDKIGEIKKHIRSNDLLFLFFSGHGLYDENTFILKTYNYNRDIPSTKLKYGSLLYELNTLKCNKVLFLDACKSGSVDQTNNLIIDLTPNSSSYCVFTSSTKKQLSYEDVTWHNGAFTEALIDIVLEQEQDITIGDLNHFLSKKVSTIVKKIKKQKQDPNLPINGLGNNFILIKK